MIQDDDEKKMCRYIVSFSLFSKQTKIVVKVKRRKSNANFFFGIIRKR